MRLQTTSAKVNLAVLLPLFQAAGIPSSSAIADPIRPLADEPIVVFASPDPARVFAYSPGIVRLESGRLVATLDLGGPAAEGLPGPKFNRRVGYGRWWQGKVFTSDDGGRTWKHRADYPMMHARPFVAGDLVYVLGQADDVAVIRSRDGGETFTAPSRLTEGEWWTQAPSNVHYANGCVYLTMRYAGSRESGGPNPGEAASVLMRGEVDADLTRRENWTFASKLTAAEALAGLELDGFGVPFFTPHTRLAPGRRMGEINWGESQVVQFFDPDHVWFDPRAKTFHLWARANTGNTGYVVVLKVVEQEDGRMITQLERAPSGKKMLFVPCPGGQMKFHVLYDAPSRRYWLLSTQATDSMIRPDRMPADRYNLPNNERRRLQLHFSKNMIDWCFAGLVAVGPVEHASRHYASMAIDGNDLVILSRSGDERAKSAHDGNLITFHRVKSFRELVY